MIRSIAIALVTTSLLTGAAFAQTSTTAQKNAAEMAAVSHKAGEYRASKLVGVNVYNQANDKIGEINDVILDKSGKVASVVLGVGGFLGMGEHNVAVAFDKLKWVNEPVRSTTADNANANRTTGTASSTPARAANENWYPDHVVYNSTKDELKALPQFKY